MRLFDYLDHAIRGVNTNETPLTGADARNYEMLLQRANGKTLDEIGAMFGLTRERVRQIIDSIAPGQSKALKKIQKGREELENNIVSERASSWVLAHKGCTRDEVVSSTGIALSDLKKFLTKESLKYVQPETKKNNRPNDWLDDDILEALRKAGTYHFPLSRYQYDELVRMKEVHGPSAALIYKRFGNWTIACGLVGVETNQAHDGYQVTWNKSELAAFMLRFVSDAPSTSIQEYEKWRAAQPDRVPSGQLIRNTWSNWPSAIKASLLLLRSEWSTTNE